MAAILLGLITAGPLLTALAAPKGDPCTKIAGQTFVPPHDALACLKSFPFNKTLQDNVMDVVSGVFDFFAFEDWYFDPPAPFQDSRIAIPRRLAWIRHTHYATDYDFNRAVFDFTNRLNDGHTLYIPNCYRTFRNFLPTPVVTLEENGTQAVFVMPDLVQLMSSLDPDFTSYFDEIGFDWRRLAGAKVIDIEGLEAYDYADKIASMETGTYLDHGVRVNSVFSSYIFPNSDFTQRFGDIAERSFPDQNTLTMTLMPADSKNPETVKIPFLSAYVGGDFTDKASFWEANCVARSDTNGVDARGSKSFRGKRRQPKGVITDRDLASIMRLSRPSVTSVSTVSEGSGAIQSSILPSNKTGVLFVGSFEADVGQFQEDVKATTDRFKEAGVTRLIVDLTNNGGGNLCLGQFLHQYLAGAKIGYPGVQTTSRANPLAQKILAAYIAQGHTNPASFYAPDNWVFLNDTQMPPTFNYNNPSVPFPINGRTDPQSIRFHDACTPFDIPIPEEALFDLKDVVIVTNANCASACALFSTIMFERHQTKIAVFGGKPGLQMEYKGMGGHQVMEWSELDTEIKTAGLKDDPLAPPDFLVNANMRHSWRIGWSSLNESYPIAFLSQLPQYRFPYTKDTYANPQNLWLFAESQLFS